MLHDARAEMRIKRAQGHAYANALVRTSESQWSARSKQSQEGETLLSFQAIAFTGRACEIALSVTLFLRMPIPTFFRLHMWVGVGLRIGLG